MSTPEVVTSSGGRFFDVFDSFHPLVTKEIGDPKEWRPFFPGGISAEKLYERIYFFNPHVGPYFEVDELEGAKAYGKDTPEGSGVLIIFPFPPPEEAGTICGRRSVGFCQIPVGIKGAGRTFFINLSYESMEGAVRTIGHLDYASSDERDDSHTLPMKSWQGFCKVFGGPEQARLTLEAIAQGKSDI